MSINVQGKEVTSIKPLQLEATGDQAWSNFDTRPVFLLKLSGGGERVLKGEMVDGDRDVVRDSAGLIGELQSRLGVDLGVTLLDDADIEVLKGVTSDIMVHDNRNCAAFYLSEIAKSGMFVFYTMTFIEGLRTLESKAAKNKDKDGMRVFGAYKLGRKMHGDPKLLPALGKVVAVDLFCGNKDRFDATGQIVNPGNIFFKRNEDKSYTPVGIDFFEAQGEFAKMTLALQPGQEADWAGMILMDSMRLDAFASRAIMSLNSALQLAMEGNPMPFDGVLDGNDVRAFRAGLGAGADELRVYLLGLRRRGVAPAGITSRLDALGWTQTAWAANGVRPQPRAGWTNAQPAGRVVPRGLGPNRR